MTVTGFKKLSLITLIKASKKTLNLPFCPRPLQLITTLEDCRKYDVKFLTL